MKKVHWIFFLLITLISCNNENQFEFPLVFTGEVTNIDSTGATFHAKILELGKEEIIEYGFVWDSVTNPTIDNSEKFIIYDNPEIGIRSRRIFTTFQKGVEYYVRAYIKTIKYTSYGKNVSFTSLGSLAPIITALIPDTGNLGDTLIITGENFSYKLSNNNVFFGEFPAIIIKANQDSLWVIVPSDLNTISSYVSVSVQGKRTASVNEFNLSPPVFNDFNPKIATFGSQVILNGLNFNSNPSSLHVYFHDSEAQILNIQDQSITVFVPDSLYIRQCSITIEANNLSIISNDKFQLESFLIHDFNPKVAVTGETITLTGENFSPIAKNNVVTFGGRKGTVLASSSSELLVTVPLQDKGCYPSRSVEIKVYIIGEVQIYDQNLLINDRWFRLGNFPGINTYDANCFIANDKAYIGLNNTNQFWSFSPENQSWTRLTDFPGDLRDDGTGFYLDGNIYFGTGLRGFENLKDFWVYNINTDSWKQLNNFPGLARYGASAFCIINKGYLTSGHYYEMGIYNNPFGDCWEYNQLSDSWKEISSYGDLGEQGLSHCTVVVANGIAYLGLGWNFIQGDYQNRMYRFDPSTTNKWKRIANFTGSHIDGKAIAFVFDDMPFFKTYDSDFYKYLTDTDFWLKMDWKILTDIDGGIGFSIGNKAYVGLGGSQAIWEYDPSR